MGGKNTCCRIIPEGRNGMDDEEKNLTTI